MRKLLTVATLGIFLGSGIGFAENIKKREKRQQDRIDQGVKSGNSPRKRP